MQRREHHGTWRTIVIGVVGVHADDDPRLYITSCWRGAPPERRPASAVITTVYPDDHAYDHDPLSVYLIRDDCEA